MYCKQVQTKSGQMRWECVADGPRNPATGKRNQITRRGKTKREAADKLKKEIRKQESHGIDQKVTKHLTFEMVAAEWLEQYAMNGSKKNSVRIRRREMNILNSYFAKKPISEINYSLYQRVINDMAPDYARTTTQGINTCANMIFKYAIRRQLIKHNPAQDIVIPKKRKTIEEIKETNIEEKYLNREELNEFFSAVLKYGLKDDKERFYTLAFSGMRSGELCALQKSDLDFENNIIDIHKTLYNEKNNMKGYELTPPKTDGSIRKVEMEKPIMDMLREVVRRNDKFKMQYRTLLEDYHDENFVFCRPNGYPFITKTVLSRMNRILDKTSIKKHATPHIFRHTHISMMAEAKVDLATIMKRVGHEDIETTMLVYTHVTNKMKKDASDQVSNLYGDILNNIK